MHTIARTPPQESASPTFESIGFELGWDYAH